MTLVAWGYWYGELGKRVLRLRVNWFQVYFQIQHVYMDSLGTAYFTKGETDFLLLFVMLSYPLPIIYQEPANAKLSYRRTSMDRYEAVAETGGLESIYRKPRLYVNLYMWGNDLSIASRAIPRRGYYPGEEDYPVLFRFLPVFLL